MAEQTRTVSEPRKRGITDVAMVFLAAVLIMAPSFVSGVLTARYHVDISFVGIGSLAMFAVGVFLLIKVVRT